MLLAALSLFILLSPSARALRNVVFDGYQRLLPLERATEAIELSQRDGTMKVLMDPAMKP